MSVKGRVRSGEASTCVLLSCEPQFCFLLFWLDCDKADLWFNFRTVVSLCACVCVWGRFQLLPACVLFRLGSGASTWPCISLLSFCRMIDLETGGCSSFLRFQTSALFFFSPPLSPQVALKATELNVTLGLFCCSARSFQGLNEVAAPLEILLSVLL